MPSKTKGNSGSLMTEAEKKAGFKPAQNQSPNK